MQETDKIVLNKNYRKLSKNTKVSFSYTKKSNPLRLKTTKDLAFLYQKKKESILLNHDHD